MNPPLLHTPGAAGFEPKPWPKDYHPSRPRPNRVVELAARKARARAARKAGALTRRAQRKAGR